MPPGELFAIGSAVSFAVNNITVKNALRTYGSPFTALITILTAAAALWATILLGNLAMPSSLPAVALFAIRGLLDPGISALLIFMALRKVGVTITVPIIAASPVVSTTLSAIFLGETLNASVISGTALVIGGVATLTFKQNQAKASTRYVIVAALGSAAIGAAAFVTKLALNSSSTPLSGLGIAFLAAAILQAVIAAALGRGKEIPLSWNGAKWFALAGIFAAAAFTLMFLAIASGNISVIFPLLSTQPLFALILSFIMLRQQEKITRNVVLGTAAIVAGAALLSVA